MIQITEHPIDYDAAWKAIADENAGANLVFMGTTRRWTGDVETVTLNYECYREMAKKELEKLCNEASERWELKAICVIHRIGDVPVGEASLAVAISSAHRVAAFESGQWIIDRIKEVVPIWKQEIAIDGQTKWVHPESEATS